MRIPLGDLQNQIGFDHGGSARSLNLRHFSNGRVPNGQKRVKVRGQGRKCAGTDGSRDAMPLLSQPSSPCCSCTPTSLGSIFAHSVGMITGAISQAAGERLNSFSSTSASRWGTYHRFLGATHDCNPNHRGDLAAQGSHPARTCHGRFCRLERRKRTRCRGANGGYGAPSGKTRRPSGQAPSEAHWSHGEASRKAPVTPI